MLDPFAGSASTLLAARMSARQYLGMEIEPHMHEIAVRRMQAFEGRLASILEGGRAPANQDAALALAA